MNAQVLCIFARNMGEVRMRGWYADDSPGAVRAAGSWSMRGVEFVLSEDVPQGADTVRGHGVNPVVGGSLAEPHFIGQWCGNVAIASLQEACSELRGWQRDLHALVGTCRSLWASRFELELCAGLAEFTLLHQRMEALYRQESEDLAAELRIYAVARMKQAAREVPRAEFLELARSIAAQREESEEEELDDDSELDDSELDDSELDDSELDDDEDL